MGQGTAVMLFVYLSLIVSCFIIAFLLLYLVRQAKQKRKIKPVWFEFKRKIWMTLGLGIFFFIVYCSAVLLLSYGLSFDAKQKLLSLAHQSPADWIYAGLWLFACTTLCIYLVRMCIKFCYLMIGKDF